MPKLTSKSLLEIEPVLNLMEVSRRSGVHYMRFVNLKRERIKELTDDELCKIESALPKIR